MKRFFLSFILVLVSSTTVLAEQYKVDCEYSISYKIVFYSSSDYSPDIYIKSKSTDFQWERVDPDDHINVSKSEVVLKIPTESPSGNGDRVLINFKSNNVASVFYYNSSDDYTSEDNCIYTIR